MNYDPTDQLISALCYLLLAWNFLYTHFSLYMKRVSIDHPQTSIFFDSSWVIWKFKAQYLHQNFIFLNFPYFEKYIIVFWYWSDESQSWFDDSLFLPTRGVPNLKILSVYSTLSKNKKRQGREKSQAWKLCLLWWNIQRSCDPCETSRTKRNRMARGHQKIQSQQKAQVHYILSTLHFSS